MATDTEAPADRATTPAAHRWRLPLALLVAVVVAVGLWLTQPWLLFVDVTAEESLPVVAVDPTADEADAGDDAADGGTEQGDTEDVMGGEQGEPDGADQAGVDRDAATDDTDASADDASATPAPPAGPVALSRGTFISRDHGTTGTATIVELEDGSRVLTIENLDTDNGPDLFVYLDDTAADGPEGEWDDGTSLGRLRANQGDLVYEIPDDLDLSRITSVGIWCDRFSSLFGAADLAPVG